MAVMLDTSKQWTFARRALRFCELRQRGNTEGVLHLSRLPRAREAETLREALGVRKRREVSALEMARLRNMGFKRALIDDLEDCGEAASVAG